MNSLIVLSALGWVVAMSIILSHTTTLYIHVIGTAVILINIISIIFYLIKGNDKKMLEFRIYSDNIAVIFLILMFPKCCFYGCSIQILLSIFINHFYLKSKIHIYNILMFQLAVETCLYFSINMFKFTPQVICNSLCSILLISVLIILKNKILICPEMRFKKMVNNVNAIFRHEVIETISPLTYYTSSLKKENKARVGNIITKLINLSQDKIYNFGEIITLIRASLCFTYSLPVNIVFIEKIDRSRINLDSYLLILIMYSILDGLVANHATEITIEHNSKGVNIVDNGAGFDLKSKTFARFNFKSAMDLLEICDIPVKCVTSMNSGTSLLIHA